MKFFCDAEKCRCVHQHEINTEEAMEFIAQSVKGNVDMAKIADAIKAIKPKWFSVEEHLPDDGQEVLLKTKDFGYVVGIYKADMQDYEPKRRFIIHRSIDSADMAVVEVLEWQSIE